MTAVTQTLLAPTTDPQALLRAAQVRTRPALAQALDRLDARTRHVAGYHRGWWDADAAPGGAGPTESSGSGGDHGSGGKALRPALALLSALAVGATEPVALPGAVSAELVHDFSLLHDDVLDGDERRRHRPAAWCVFGTPDALLTGDALLSLATEVLLDVGTGEALDTARALSRAVRGLVEGQVADVSFERRSAVSVEECLQMAAGKTAALLSYAAGSGARLAGAPPAVVAALEEYGHETGMGFQLVDDLLGIWGDPATTGKPVGSDLRARKKTVPVTLAMSGSSAAASRLRQLLASDGELDDRALAEAADLVESTGARSSVEQFVQRHHDRAVAALHREALEPVARTALAELSASLTSRVR